MAAKYIDYNGFFTVDAFANFLSEFNKENDEMALYLFGCYGYLFLFLFSPKMWKNINYQIGENF